jgi:hypothetical protein
MRRFAFIEVESPTDAVIRELVQGPGDMVSDLLSVRQFVDLGPAVFIDAAAYASRRIEDPSATRSRVLFETFYAYFLPQLDRLDDAEARDMYNSLAWLFDPPELNHLRRVIRTVLGSGADASRGLVDLVRNPPDGEGVVRAMKPGRRAPSTAARADAAPPRRSRAAAPAPAPAARTAATRAPRRAAR